MALKNKIPAMQLRYSACLITLITLFITSACFRRPGNKDFILVNRKQGEICKAIKNNGFYYLTVADGQEYSHYFLYFYHVNNLVLIEFGSKISDMQLESWKKIAEAIITDKKNMNCKGVCRATNDSLLTIELCRGYPTRGYYFVNYKAELINEKIIIKQTGYRKYKSIMKDFSPYFGTLGTEKPDTLTFKKFE